MRISDWSSDVCSSDLIDAHDEDQIDVLDEIVQHLGRGGGIERHARLLAQGLDMLDCTVDMRPCFRMNRNDVCARLRKSFEILVHRRNHEMDVQGLGRMRTKIGRASCRARVCKYV